MIARTIAVLILLAVAAILTAVAVAASHPQRDIPLVAVSLPRGPALVPQMCPTPVQVCVGGKCPKTKGIA